LTISRAILIFGLITAAGLGAVIATSVYGLAQLKVGGPLYNQIKLGNDLIADILPPPEYVIEAYLEATLALHDPAQLAAHRDRLAQLKKEYDERREFWIKSDLDPVLKAKLVEKSDSEVQRFWSALQDGMLPALAKGDSAAAAKAYAEITARYTAHRAIIDDIVKQTNDQNGATEVAATGRVSTFTLILWSVFRRGVSRYRRRHFRRRVRRHPSDCGNDRGDEGSCRRRSHCFHPGAQPRR
jgi:hypothetical protein